MSLLALEQRIRELNRLGWWPKRWLKLILMMWSYKMQTCWFMIMYLVRILFSVTKKTLQWKLEQYILVWMSLGL